MSTHLLLEGEDIESVLTRLRDEHGPDAKIIQAEMVRVGGIAGFFARKRYEVTVEVDEDAPVAGPTPFVLPDLGPIAARPPAPAPMAGIEALLSAAEHGDQAEIGGAVLAENARAATPPATPAATPTGLPTATPTGLPPVESVTLPDSPAPLRDIAMQGWHRPVSTEGLVFQNVLSSLTRGMEERQAAVPVVEPLGPTAAYGEPTPEPPPAEPAPAEQAATTAVKGPALAELERTRSRLAAIGIPARLVAGVTCAEPLLALRDVVDTLAAPTRPQWRSSATRGGAVIVVLGSWALARPTVQRMVEEFGIDPDAVLAVATPAGDDGLAGHAVRSHAAAIALVRQTRQAHSAAVVVVDPGPSMHTAARVAALVGTLEPQFTVVAADATDDLDAARTALDALDRAGLAADAVAVEGVARTDRPAAVFELPAPVSWVDGRPATRGGWLGLLMDALPAAR